MGYGKALRLLLILTVTLCSLPLLLTTSLALALQSPNGAFSARDARADVRAAERNLERAETRLREARHVERDTRAASDRYGHDVGRWVRLARHVGWPWGQIPMLMYVIHRESGGNPAAKNPASTASGLLQFLSSWWYGKWNPFNAAENLHHGFHAWLNVRWQPWGM